MSWHFADPRNILISATGYFALALRTLIAPFTKRVMTIFLITKLSPAVKTALSSLYGVYAGEAHDLEDGDVVYGTFPWRSVVIVVLQVLFTAKAMKP